jgi:maleate isomerase
LATDEDPRRSLVTKLGLLLPSVNTVTEPEFQAAVPERVSVHTARMFIDGTEVAAVERMLATELPGALRQIASIRPDVVVLACTAAGAVGGEGGLLGEIERATGARAVGMSSAVRTALRDSGATRVGVLTAYTDDATAKIADGLRADGMVVAVAAGLGIVEPVEIADVRTDELLDFAARELDGAEFDALLISCGNLHSARARDVLVERYGVPVITSNDATLQAALRALSLAVS